MYAAEEAVLWKLTGQVVEATESIQSTLDKVGPCCCTWYPIPKVVTITYSASKDS